MTHRDQLNTIFQMVFDDDSIQIHEAMTANDVDGWDSLSHVNLICAVEHHFNIRFNQPELLVLRNVGDLLHAIGTKLEQVA